MEAQIVPDSPYWNFTNSSNVSDCNSFCLAYCASNKVVLVDLATGKTQSLVLSGNSDAYRKPVFLCLSEEKLVCAYKQGHLEAFELSSLGSIWSLEMQSEILGVSFWKESLVCSDKESVSVIEEGRVVKKYSAAGPVKCSGDWCVVLEKGKVCVLQREINQLNKQCLVCDAKVWNGNFYLAVVHKEVTIYKNMQVLMQRSLPKSNCKMKNPVHSVLLYSEENLFVSLLNGEIVIYSETNSRFMNNTHTKAIMGLYKTPSGVLSVSMDRKIIHWRVQVISGIFYTEPIWELLTLEASVHSLDCSCDNLYVACGKKTLFLYQTNTEKVLSRSIWKCFQKEIDQVVANTFNSDLVALVYKDLQLVVLSVPEESILSYPHLQVTNCRWISQDKLVLVSSDSTFFIYDTQELNSLFHIDFKVTCIFVEEFIWVGTFEGNVLKYNFSGDRLYSSTVHEKEITCMELSEQGLAVASQDTNISVHSESFKLLKKHTRPVLAVCWTPKYLCSSGMDHTIQLWSLPDLTAKGNIREHLGAVRFLCWANALVSGSDDQTVRIWNLDSEFKYTKPPKLPTSKKYEGGVKSLLGSLHFYVYQQNREEALNSILTLLTCEEQTTQNKLFRMSRENAQSLVEEVQAETYRVELEFWVKGSQNQSEASGEVINLDKDWSDLAPLLGHNQFQHECSKKAEEAFLKRKLHKAGVYWLGAGVPSKVVEMYLEKRMHLEALVLAALWNLDTQSIYLKWAEKLQKFGKHEQAVKCFIAANNYRAALDALKQCSCESETIERIKSVLSNH